ncbi:5'-methylthioadenosine/adenosylhomocysteine nucleosidase [Patescibacteria group bacterium]|nr:5'-methylthioadenosine/adenosylhomocysteine nucleosidase [Patescibacteria group bacterium]
MKIKFALLGALSEEVEAFKQHLKQIKHVTWQEYEFWLGELFGQPVVITKSGVGKVHAALVTQKIIDEYHPEAVIFTGVGGALNPLFEIGDMVISNELVQHDFSAHPLFPRYTIPRFNRTDTFHLFLADADLVRRAQQHTHPSQNVFVGKVLTGDQFLSRSQRAAHAHLTEELQGDVIEMEGAAVAQVCTVNQLPFVIIRTISDKADDNAAIDFDAFLSRAAENSVGIVRTILESYAKS